MVPSRSPWSRASAARYMAMWAGKRANSSSSTTTISADGASNRRSTSSSRSSTPATSPVTMRAPMSCMASTGRLAKTSAGQRLEQAAHGGVLAVPLQLRRGQLDERRRPLGVPGGHRVANRLRPVVVGLAPVAGPPVELGDELRRLVQQVGPQHVGEEVVVPVPAAAVVERDEEQVGPLQRLEPGRAAVLAGHGVAQRAGQPAQHRGLEQEGAHVLGLAGQDLAHEVVDDEAVVPGEAGDEAGDVVPVLHRQGGELEGGDPPLRAGVQRSRRRRRSGRGPCASLRYAPASSAVNRRSAARISTSSPRARNRARGNAGSARLAITRWTCGGRWSSRNAIPSWMSGALDDVVVVEHQHDVVGDGVELVEQGGQDGFDGRRGRLEDRERRPPPPRAPLAAGRR